SPTASTRGMTVVYPSAVSAQSLTIQSGSTYVIDFTRPSTSTINLIGNFTNAGIVYVVTTNPALTSATISASNIFNLHGALLTTVLPVGGLPGFTSLR